MRKYSEKKKVKKGDKHAQLYNHSYMFLLFCFLCLLLFFALFLLYKTILAPSDITLALSHIRLMLSKTCFAHDRNM